MIKSIDRDENRNHYCAIKSLNEEKTLHNRNFFYKLKLCKTTRISLNLIKKS